MIPTGPGNTELQIMMMMALKATGFVGQPSYLMTILDKAAEMSIGADVMPIKKALFSAEPYTPSQRERFESEYGMNTTSALWHSRFGIHRLYTRRCAGILHNAKHFLADLRSGIGRLAPRGRNGRNRRDYVQQGVSLDSLRYWRSGRSIARVVMRRATVAGPCSDAAGGRDKSSWHVPPPEPAAIRGDAIPREIKDLQVVITRLDNRDVVTVNIELHEGAATAGIAEKLQTLAQQAVRLRIDSVNFVAAGSVDGNARKIVDEREWD